MSNTEPKYASITGVQYSDVTYNLVQALREETHTVVLDDLLVAIGYTEHTEADLEHAARLQGKFPEALMPVPSPPPVVEQADLDALTRQTDEAQKFLKQGNDEQGRRIAIEVVRGCDHIIRHATDTALSEAAQALKAHVGFVVFSIPAQA